MPKRRGTPARGPDAKRRQRTASPGKDLDLEEPCNLADAGELATCRSNSIDFEQIIRASNILPKEKLTESLTGCGSQIEPTIPQIRLGDKSVAVHIPKATKDQITRGGYINLALLLKGTITGYNQSVTGCGSQRRHCSCYSTKTHPHPQIEHDFDEKHIH